MSEAAQQHEYARLVELDYQFHAAVCRASGNSTLYEAWVAVSGKVRLYLSTTNLMYPDPRAIVQGHRAILGALRSQRGDRAHRAMQDHLGEMLDAFVAQAIGKPRKARTRGSAG
jgi:DNA-binding GntR family transcriptional regulator